MVELAGFAAGALDLVVKTGLVMGFAGAAGIGMWILNSRLKYKFHCTTFTFDSSKNVITEFDRGGVFTEGRTNHKRFWMKKKKGYSFDPDQIKFVAGPKGSKQAFFVKYGEKDIRPLNMNLQPNPGVSVQIGEPDLNWFLSEKARWDKVIFPNKLLQWLPWIGLFFVGTIFLIIMVSLLNKFDILNDIAINLKESAAYIAQAKAGSAVLP